MSINMQRGHQEEKWVFETFCKLGGKFLNHNFLKK